MKLFKKSLCTILVILTLMLTIAPMQLSSDIYQSNFSSSNFVQDENSYTQVLSQWLEAGYEEISQTRHDYDFTSINAGTNNVIDSENSFGYGKSVIEYLDGDIEVEVFIPQAGLYELSIAYYSLTTNIIPNLVSVKINNKVPYNEASQINLKTYWQDETSIPYIDRYGNEILSKQIQFYQWVDASLESASGLLKDPLLFYFKQGTNKIQISKQTGAFLLGQISIKSKTIAPLYEEYLLTHNDKPIVNETLITYEAEIIKFKNSSQLRSGPVRDVSAIPFSLVELKLNVLDGNTYDEPGESVTYQIEVNESGLYQLSFKTKQPFNSNSPSFRSILIDGILPFEEASNIAFPYSTKWINTTLSNEDNIPYLFYLTKGSHNLELKVNASLYEPIYRSLQSMILSINSLTLDIKQLTGNNSDPNRDWDVEQYLPGITKQLEDWKSMLMEFSIELHVINNTSKKSRDIVFIDSAVKNLNRLIKDINELPYRLNILSEGSGSVSQLIGDAMANMIVQPLSVDRFYIHGDDKLPRAERNVFVKMWIGIRRFFKSFSDSPYSEEVAEDELSVWVNRNRQIVDIMQQMTDRQFTEETGIKVKFQLMPDESKLILANAANSGPDLAMGTQVNLAYNLALRDTTYDLTNFEDFNEMLEIYEHNGAIIPFIHDGGIYGLPETQNFNILFYRKDIFQALNLDVPNTWDDVIGILPELQRFGMNFFIPLAYANSYKTVDTTVPFIYQFGGLLYDENGMETLIDNENGMKAIQFMTDLFTIYSLPQQVASFYHQFRYGVLPIGIGDFGVYVQLSYAAPEIQNMWGIALIPGVEDSEGNINRDTTGPGHGMMILESSEKKDEAWEFMKWWMETEIQVEFEQTMTTTLGNEYMWNSANLDAFRLSSWKNEDKEILLEQWQYLRNVPNTPASYMLEREISNLWNEIVLSGINVRDAVDASTVKINRELNRRLIEFGYVNEQGNMIFPYNVATLEFVEAYRDED